MVVNESDALYVAATR